MKSIGSAIKAQLVKLELTQKQAAKKVGLSPNYFGHICRDAAGTYVSEKAMGRIVSRLKVARINRNTLERNNERAKRFLKIYRARRAKAQSRTTRSLKAK